MRTQSIENKKLSIISRIANINDKSIIDSILKLLNPETKSEMEISNEKKETIKNIQDGLQEIDLIKKGKLKTKSLKDFLDEL
jgi:hypothetical protein